METIKGRVWVLGDDIDTDIIIPTDYLALKTIEDMKQYAFSPLRPELAGRIQDGDIIVGGTNFGCGSSREQAPSVLKALGVQAVIAKSFARIFYRNAINIGLPVIISKELYEDVSAGDAITVSLETGTIEYKGKTYECTKLPPYMQNILNKGGLISFLNKEEA